jgi:hypothetical protein
VGNSGLPAPECFISVLMSEGLAAVRLDPFELSVGEPWALHGLDQGDSWVSQGRIARST